MNEDPRRFWMVHGDGTGPTNCRHPSYDQAKNEAKRLARMTPGTAFYVLESVSAHVKIDVRDMQITRGSESALGDEIPF